MLCREDQEVTLTLIHSDVQARRQQRTLVERSPVESHATMGASGTLGEMLREDLCRCHVRADGRTPYEFLRNNSYRADLLVLAKSSGVPRSRLLRGKFEVKWLELVWLGKTENTEEHLFGDKHGVRKFWTIRRQPESAKWRREYVDNLTGDPFTPQPKSSTAMGRGDLPVDRKWGTRASPNTNIDEAPGDEVPVPAVTQHKTLVRF